MIFVTVGGMRGFPRLVVEMDRIAGQIDEQVVMQIGSTSYMPRNCDHFRYMSRDELRKVYARARLVVSHAGTGSILAALEQGRPLVLVPRLKEYREVFDDHQLEVARELETQGVAVVHDIAGLESAIQNVGTGPARPAGGGDLVMRLKEYLDRLAG